MSLSECRADHVVSMEFLSAIFPYTRSHVLLIESFKASSSLPEAEGCLLRGCSIINHHGPHESLI